MHGIPENALGLARKGVGDDIPSYEYHKLPPVLSYFPSNENMYKVLFLTYKVLKSLEP